jgi:hypothetical protein
MAGMVVLAVQRGARAQVGPVPVVVLSTTNASAMEATPRLSRVAAALSNQARVGPALSEQLRERYGRRPPSVNTMLDAQARVDAARTAYNNAAAANDSANMNAALDALERVAGELEQQQDILATFPDAREQLARALLFIANSTIQSSPARADDAVRRLAMVDPQRVLAARAASSAVRQAFAQRVQEMATAGLVVQSVPTGCEVFRDGRSVGNAPAQLSNLSPGSHLISVRCGGRMSLMHPISVASGATATLVIDAQLDAALDLTDTPMLRYPSVEAGRARWIEDLAKLGSALGATRIMGLVSSEDRVIAVDVVSATIVGESPVTDGAQLRRLATSEGLQSGARTVTGGGSTATAQGASTTSGNGAQDGQSNTVRTPTVGVAGDSATQRQAEWREETREVRGGVPAGAFVLGALGLGAIGGGVALGVLSQSNLNRAQQLGGSMTDLASQWQGYMDNASLFSALSITSYAVGGTLIVTGTLVGIFGRSTTVVSERVRVIVSAAPSSSGLSLIVGGAL